MGGTGYLDMLATDFIRDMSADHQEPILQVQVVRMITLYTTVKKGHGHHAYKGNLAHILLKGRAEGVENGPVWHTKFCVWVAIYKTSVYPLVFLSDFQIFFQKFLALHDGISST